MFMPRKAKELDGTETQAEDINEFDESFSRDFPHFTAHRKDIRALATVRRKFNLGRYEDLNVFVLAYDRDVSADRVFARDDKNSVVFYSTRASIRRALEARGHEAKKANLEQRAESERADIFIALDPELSVTKRLRENIVPRGLVLCRLPAANALRPYGYTFRAIIEMRSGTPTLSRHDDPTFWKSVQVDSDKAFREAGSDEQEGVVTYEYARQKVHEAKKAGVPEMSESDVFGSYSRLIEMAEEQHRDAPQRGETVLSLSTTVDDTEVTISGINTVLPTKKAEHDDDIVVMKKGLM